MISVKPALVAGFYFLEEFSRIFSRIQSFQALNSYQPLQRATYPYKGTFKHALIHHEDIDFTVPIDYTGEEIKWPDIADRLKKAFQNPQLIFTKIPPVTRNLMEKIRQKSREKANVLAFNTHLPIYWQQFLFPHIFKYT